MQSVQSMQKHKRAPQNHGFTAQVRLPALHTLHTCIPAENRCGAGRAGGTAIRASHLDSSSYTLYSIYTTYNTFL